MKLRVITLLVAVCLSLSLLLDVFSLFQYGSFFIQRAVKIALQIPLILFFFSLWQRQRSEDEQS